MKLPYCYKEIIMSLVIMEFFRVIYHIIDFVDLRHDVKFVTMSILGLGTKAIPKIYYNNDVK